LKLVENADDQAAADPSLLRILARAHHIQARLSQNPKLTVHDIAREAFCKFPRAPLASRAIFGFAWRRLLAPSRKKSTTKWRRRDFHGGRGRNRP